MHYDSAKDSAKIWTPAVLNQAKHSKNVLLPITIEQRSPNFLDAGPKSWSYQRSWAGLFCPLKKTKQKATCFTLDTFVHCNLFSLFGNMFAMWCLQLLLLLGNSCNIWFHAWRCNTLIASTILKNSVYLTNHWLDSRDVVET